MLTVSLCLLMVAQLALANAKPSASDIPTNAMAPFANGMLEGPLGPQLGCDAELPVLWPSEVCADDLCAEGLPSLPATQFSLSVLPRFGDDGFGIQAADVRHSWLMGYGALPPLTITPGIAAQSWTGPTNHDLPANVFELYTDFEIQLWANDSGSLSLGATPGFYGDLEVIDQQTFQWTGWFLASRPVTSDWTLLGGAAYVRQLRSHWLPMGGAVWTPSDSARCELVFPRPKVAGLFYDDGTWAYWGYLAGQFGGGAWSVEDTPQTNVLVAYSDLRLVHGWEAFSVDGYEWRAEIGYVFARDLSVNDTSVTTPADTFLAQLMFAF